MQSRAQRRTLIAWLGTRDDANFLLIPLGTSDTRTLQEYSIYDEDGQKPMEVEVAQLDRKEFAT